MKTIKKALSLFLTAAIILTLFVGTGMTASATILGICGDNLTWQLDADTGVLTISGTGAMNDFYESSNYAPWHSNLNNIRTVTIEDGVTSIGENALIDCFRLTSIAIPSTVTSIGRYAFYGCINLTSVTIPDSVLEIDEKAFLQCESLRSLTISSSVTSIGNRAFQECSNLTDVFYVGTGAQWNKMKIDAGNDDLTHAVIHFTMELTATPLSDFSYRLVHGGIHITGYIGSDTTVQIAESYIVKGSERIVTNIEESAFEGNESITYVSIPATVDMIGDYAFYDCNALTDVTLWSKYAEIGELAFGYYYIDRTKDGKVDGFTLTTYDASTACQYLAENGLTFRQQTKPVGKGDVDANGEYNAADLRVIKCHLLAFATLQDDWLSAADINDDNAVDIRDLVAMKKKIAAQT